jgi:hypothetical protein
LGAGEAPSRLDGDVSRGLQHLLDLRAGSQTHLFPAYAYGGILPPPFTVGSYLCKKKKPGRASRRPTLSQGGLWSSATHPIYRETTSQCGEGVLRRGDKGGTVSPLSTSPSPKDVDLGEASVPHLFTAVGACKTLNLCANMLSKCIK